MEVAIVSGCDTVRYASYVGHQLYARKHGFAYHLELAPFEGHAGYWHKVKALSAHLDDYDWLVWLDDDAFITNLAEDFLRREILAAEAAGCFVAIAPSVSDELNGAWAAYNSGVFALKNCAEAREMLAVALDPPLDDIRAWWDTERLGMYTKGDQDVFAWFLETQRPNGVHWVTPERWNARPWSYGDRLSDCPICHFPGHPDKTLAIAEFARRMRVGQALVPGSDPAVPLVTAISRQTPTASTASIIARRALRRAEDLRKRVARKIRWIRETGSWS